MAKIHILLTNEIRKNIPETTKIVQDFGYLTVVFPTRRITGLHCFIEDDLDVIIRWLKTHEEFIKGNGVPMMETFEAINTKELI